MKYQPSIKVFRLFVQSLVTLSLLQSCVQHSVIGRAMESSEPAISTVRDALDRHEVQIIFTEISRQGNGDVEFVDHEYLVDDERYFYPASTVKLAIAALALEKLAKDPRIDRQTPFSIGNSQNTQTVSDAIQKIMVVSDNEAYNQLFEYLGKDEINGSLMEKGIVARISHRLSTENSDRLNYSPITFHTSSGKIVSQISNGKPLEPLTLSNVTKGEAYVENGELVEKPFDFSLKNYLPLRSLHGIMRRLLFPELFSFDERFNMKESDRVFFLEAMKTLPFQLGYDREEYYDSYVKFLIFGDSKTPMPEGIEIYNKVGFAYGTLTDTAYIKDLNNQKEFLISATVLVNENEKFNDDDYEYETIGIPFLAELGRQLTQ